MRKEWALQAQEPWAPALGLWSAGGDSGPQATDETEEAPSHLPLPPRHFFEAKLR